MFETLAERLDGVLSRLRGRGRLSEEDLEEALGGIRRALLEADVNLNVARSFVERVRQRCAGAELVASLTPGQLVVKYVNEELTAVLGGETLRINYSSTPPTVVLLAGLQGSGKTTASVKLARWFRQAGRQPLLVGADRQRPAAVDQLRVLAAQTGVPVFSEDASPVHVAERGVGEARRLGRDVVVVDTAGRLSIDQVLMEEIRQISLAIEPSYTFLVIDAMTGQDAVNTAQAFHETLALDGVILTKLDGDARGGAVLSVKETVGRPVAFASTGEKLADFDAFHPDRMASRILGMGDVLSLIERAEQDLDQEVAARGAERLVSGSFTLEDFLDQMRQVRRMGPLSGILGLLPGVPKEVRNAQLDDRELDRVEAVICSMTPAERRDPAVVNGSRRLRIARGSGRTTTDVNNLLKQFKEMQRMMKAMPGLGSGATKPKRGRTAAPAARRGRSGVDSLSEGIADLWR